MAPERISRTGLDDTTTTSTRFFRHPMTSVATVVLSMFAMILGSGLLSAGFYLLVRWSTGEHPAAGLRAVLQIISVAMTTVIAVLLVALWRKLARLPVQGFGLAPHSRMWLLVPGFALAVGVNYAAAGVAVLSGASTWNPPLFTAQVLLSVVVIFLGQAFPEELLWRGHLADLLARRLSRTAVVLTTAGAFGAIHIVSGSDAQGVGEQLLYVLQAFSLGLVTVAMRYGTLSLWMAIGFHTGYNAFFDIAAPAPGRYGIELVARALLLAACALPLLLGQRRPHSDRRTVG